ncbi:alpha-L-fucosidase [Maribellus luteus]|nr:alpha-L-fucosidase [Maribellus luteus]
MNKILVFISFALLLGACSPTQVAPPLPFGPLPNKQQMQWHNTEFYGFVHFTINTFTDKEWGFGNESPELFNPSDFNAAQIVKTTKDAGMKGLILTCKHHDGFCLWPTKTTEHNISKSPFENGKGDIVRAISDECRKQGLKFGVYLSPWDRNNPAYGTPAYIDIFRAQLTELLTSYGDVFEVWFDGANGGTGYYGGANEKREINRVSYYDWDNTFALVRKLQPNAAIFSDIGPDARWVGTEAGFSGDPCWNRYTPEGREPGIPPANGQTKYWEALNGHREGKYWMPAEVDVSIRPGWFYHMSEDDKVKTPEKLLDIYYNSIGHGATFLLNLPPDRRGQIHENDIKSLNEFKTILDETFSVDLTKGAKVTASNVRGNSKNYQAQNVLDDDPDTYWASDDEILTNELVINFQETTSFNLVNIQEYIALGQRVWGWTLDKWENEQWVQFTSGESIGHRRLWRGPMQTTSRLRLRITQAGACPLISKFSVHSEPSYLVPPTIARDKDGNLTIAGQKEIRYTTDGSDPDQKSMTFTTPFDFSDGGVVKAKIFTNGKAGTTAIKQFNYLKKKWKVISGNEDSHNNNNLFDEDETTVWVSTSKGKGNLVVDMGETLALKSFSMFPRKDGIKSGLITRYQLWVANDTTNWALIKEGEFSNIYNNPVEQVIPFKETRNARYLKFVFDGIVNDSEAQIAEIGVSVEKTNLKTTM